MHQGRHGRGTRRGAGSPKDSIARRARRVKGEAGGRKPSGGRGLRPSPGTPDPIWMRGEKMGAMGGFVSQ